MKEKQRRLAALEAQIAASEADDRSNDDPPRFPSALGMLRFVLPRAEGKCERANRVAAERARRLANADDRYCRRQLERVDRIEAGCRVTPGGDLFDDGDLLFFMHRVIANAERAKIVGRLCEINLVDPRHAESIVEKAARQSEGPLTGLLFDLVKHHSRTSPMSPDAIK